MLLSVLLSVTLAGLLTSAKHCSDLTISLPQVKARQGFYKHVPIAGNHDAVAFGLKLVQNGHNYSQEQFSHFQNVNTPVKIDATYCEPDSGPGSALQFLIHGIGFDKAYWDLPLDNGKYSYANVAVDKFGYSTLAISRPGNGLSSKLEPLNTLQAPVEAAVVYEITQQLRAGKVPKISKKYSKIYHIGHSFGSGLTYALSAMYPSFSDGIVLTGFSASTKFLPAFVGGLNLRLASGDQPKRFGKLPNGYLTWSSKISNIFDFLAPGYFSDEVLNYAETHKGPVGLGELLSMSAMPKTADFAGPVMVITGDLDVPFCGGDCLATKSGAPIPSDVKPAYPKAKTFEVYIQPKTAHAINLHYNATGAYQVINSFLKKQTTSKRSQVLRA